jgi:hypothetical protein
MFIAIEVSIARNRQQHSRKQIHAYSAQVKRCRVAFRDSDGVEHAVEVAAGTLYEAVGLAIDRFRRCEHVPYELDANRDGLHTGRFHASTFCNNWRNRGVNG